MGKQIELKLKQGDLAPDFTASTNGGGKVSLSDFKGRNVILYFYPRDNTPGCTKEACAFRDEFAAFKKKGARVVSHDSEFSHWTPEKSENIADDGEGRSHTLFLYRK